jgi:ribosomal protein S12 methylthiotransferase
VKELLVISQDTSAYGVDIRYREAQWRGQKYETRFLDLARGLGELGIWVRMHYVYPYPHVDDVIPLMAERKVLPYLDIPFQHGSPTVLKRMKRPGQVEKTLSRIKAWREVCPDLTIRSTFIVGFPGETEADFADTLDLVSQARFDSAFTFQYSPRPGTEAATMPDQVPPEVVKDRFQRLLQLQERISLEANHALLGAEVELLVERSTSKTDPTRMSGRTRTNKLCHFPAPGPLAPGDQVAAGVAVVAGNPLAGEVAVAPGDLVTVRVDQAAPHHLVGGPVLSYRRRTSAGGACASAPAPRPLPAGAVPLPLVG